MYHLPPYVAPMVIFLCGAILLVDAVLRRRKKADIGDTARMLLGIVTVAGGAQIPGLVIAICGGLMLFERPRSESGATQAEILVTCVADVSAHVAALFAVSAAARTLVVQLVGS